ncbi:MAG: hypothetical protein HEQ23_05755 [Tepidisphaera sp.]
MTLGEAGPNAAFRLSLRSPGASNWVEVFLWAMISAGLLTFPILIIVKGSLPSPPLLLSLALGTLTASFTVRLFIRMERREEAEVRVNERGLVVEQRGQSRSVPWNCVRLIASPCTIIDMLNAERGVSQEVHGWHCLRLELDTQTAILACVPTREELEASSAALPPPLRSRLQHTDTPIRCEGTRNDVMGRLASKRLW